MGYHLSGRLWAGCRPAGAALTCLTASSPRPAYAHRLPLSISIACGEEGYEVGRSAAVIASFGARHISSEGDMLAVQDDCGFGRTHLCFLGFVA